MRSPILTMLLTLTLAAPAVCQRIVEDDVGAPNDTLATAMVINVGEHIAGSIATSTDRDFYSFVVTAASDIKAWTGPGFGSQVGDTVLTLRDSAGTAVLTVDDGNTSTHGFYSVLTMGRLTPGVYYLEVTPGFGSPTGSYTLDLITAPVGTYVSSRPSTQWFETPEENDPRGGGLASSSSSDSRNLGTISSSRGGGGVAWRSGPTAEDYDFWSFTLASDAVVTIKTLPGQTGTPVADTVLHLVDALTMRRLTFNDDAGASRYSCINHFLPVGTYYAVVNSNRAGDVGSYVLQIETAHVVAPSVQARTRVWPGGCGNGAYRPKLSTRAADFFSVHTEQPILGSTFVLDLTSVPANAPLSVVVDLQSTQPFLVGGATGTCNAELNLSTAFPNLQQATAGGEYFWVLPMPLDTSLAGLPLELQIAVVLNQAQSGFLLSNRVSLTCGIGH